MLPYALVITVIGFFINTSVFNLFDIFFAAVFMVLGIPLSFLTWYSAIYNALRIASALRFIYAFINLVLSLAFAICFALGLFRGIPGILYLFKSGTFDSTFLVVIILIHIVLWGLFIASNALEFVILLRLYRRRRITRDQVVTEATQVTAEYTAAGAAYAVQHADPETIATIAQAGAAAAASSS